MLVRTILSGVALLSSAGAVLAGDAAPSPARWTVAFSADAIYATRGDVANDPLIQDAVTGDTVVSGKNFGFDWAPGADLGLTITDQTVDFTGRFIGGLSFDSTVKAETPAIWTIPTAPPLFGLGVAETTNTYSSDFNSVEFNAGRDVGPVNAFVGVRAVWFNDALGTSADFGGNRADVNWSVDTTGVGPQIGAIWSGNAGPVRVNLDGRVGYLWTTSDADFSVTQDIGPPFGASSGVSGGTAIAEAGISAGVPLTSTLQLKAGYRVIWMNSMPTAIGSIANTDVLAGSIDPATDDILIHGGTVGLTAHF